MGDALACAEYRSLVSNAVKFTERGGIAITVEQSGDGYQFQFRDTGIGIPASEQSRIFQEFEQADTGLSRRFGGTGLGLAISKRIAERMGGRLTVQSSPGAGSTFSFRIALPAAGEQHAANVPLLALAGADVLIVAPTEVSASLIARQLTDWGARTCLLVDEQSARSLLSERPWSAILVDYAMGRHACEQLIRAACAIERRIVLLTPAEREEIATLRQAGFSGYLIKPVRRDSLAMQMLGEAGSVDEAYQHPRAPAPAATSDAAKRRLAVLVAETTRSCPPGAFAPDRLGHRHYRAFRSGCIRCVLRGASGRHPVRSVAHGLAHARRGWDRDGAPDTRNGGGT